MPATKTTPEQKAAALAIYAEHGPAEASRRTGIRAGTIGVWAIRKGVAHTPEQTRAAVEVSRGSLALRRAALAERMLGEAEIEMERLRSQVTERRVSSSGKLVEWTESEPSPSDRRNIATVAAILIDKSNLLAGEATSRTEVLNAEEARRKLVDEFPGLLRVVEGGAR